MPRQMSSIWMMILSSLLFALMGVCVKLASAHYSISEIVFYRSLTGLILMAWMARLQGGSLTTKHSKAHFLRSLCGTIALILWFYSIGQLPLATAMTLNYTASAWMALFVIGGALFIGHRKVNKLLLVTVAGGFAGVLMILQPTIQQNQWYAGLVGLLSGIMSAIAYLQIATLGRLGEPEYRVVFYFSLAGVILGVSITAFWEGFSPHTWTSALLLLAVGVVAAGAQWALTRAFAYGKTLVNASLQYLTIACACVFGALIFDDPLTPMAIGGMVLVVASGVMAAYCRDDGLDEEQMLEANPRQSTGVPSGVAR